MEVTASTRRVQPIFGEPTKLVTQTIIPVGGSASYSGGSEGVPFVESGGVGVSVQVIPLGFIHDEEGVVRFASIAVPVLGVPREPLQGGLVRQARERLAMAAATRARWLSR